MPFARHGLAQSRSSNSNRVKRSARRLIRIVGHGASLTISDISKRTADDNPHFSAGRTSVASKKCHPAQTLAMNKIVWATIIRMLIQPVRAASPYWPCTEKLAPGNWRGSTPTVLTARLGALIENRIVRRATLSPPINAQVYELTAIGRDLKPAIRELIRWGGYFLFPMRDDDEFEPDWVLLGLEAITRLQPSPAERFNCACDTSRSRRDFGRGRCAGEPNREERRARRHSG